MLPHDNKEITKMNDNTKPTLAAVLADTLDGSHKEMRADRPAPGTEEE